MTKREDMLVDAIREALELIEEYAAIHFEDGQPNKAMRAQTLLENALKAAGEDSG